MNRKRYRLSLFGRVQGVSFRAGALGEAQALSLSGFVRNESDGSVKIEVEGEPDSLQKFLEWCREGSPAAEVRALEVKEIGLKGDKNFVINY